MNGSDVEALFLLLWFVLCLQGSRPRNMPTHDGPRYLPPLPPSKYATLKRWEPPALHAPPLPFIWTRSNGRRLAPGEPTR